MTTRTGTPSATAVTPFDEVSVALARLEAIVARALPVAEALHGRPDDDPFRGLHLDAPAIARLLEQRAGVPAFGAAVGAALPNAAPDGSRLAMLAKRFGLSDFDVDLILVALGPELDLRYERMYAYLQDDVTRKRPTVNLALDLLCRSAEEKLERRTRFSAASPLLRHRLLEWVADPHQLSPSLLASAFRPDQQIVRFLLGHGGVDTRLARCSRLLTPAVSLDAPGLDAGAAAQLQAVLRQAIVADEPLTLCFHGRDRTSRTAAAHAVAGTLGRDLLVVDLGTDPDGWAHLPVVFREAELQQIVILLDRWDGGGLAADSGAFQMLQTALRAQRGVVVLSGDRAWTSTSEGPMGVVSRHFGVPGFHARVVCWTEGFEADGRTDTDLAQALGGRFRLRPDQIRDAVLTARRSAQSRAADGVDVVIPTAPDFFAAARQQSARELAAVATRVEATATWSDIVLPDDSLAQLREVCSRVAFSHRVLEEWGFDQRLSHGKGIAALFSGPSGTGKTMAAEVVAAELGLDLYRVDIPSVVSKWIGETEKNLDAVFRLAENAILFFDEADALFGKRSEVRDAHDRYANVEISYLLQRMETFEGLAILATNVRHHMDEAFLRRLSFVIQFPFPDDVQRQLIWERIWPSATPLSRDIDFARVARTFRFAGGNIKNVALAAAYSAAERGGGVTMDDIAHAVRREYQKLGKNIVETEFACGPPLPVLTGAGA